MELKPRSDHGELLGNHQCRQKGNVLYRENVSTPFLVRAPGYAAFKARGPTLDARLPFFSFIL